MLEWVTASEQSRVATKRVTYVTRFAVRLMTVDIVVHGGFKWSSYKCAFDDIGVVEAKHWEHPLRRREELCFHSTMSTRAHDTTHSY